MDEQQEFEELVSLTERARSLCIRQLLRANAEHRELSAIEFMQLIHAYDEILEELTIIAKTKLP
jgi:hypothetical protein